MTLTQMKRARSPKAYARKDARNLIYKRMYGEGSKLNNYPATYDAQRKHADVKKVDWAGVAVTIKEFWRIAAFDELTLAKILSDYANYSGERLLREQLQ